MEARAQRRRDAVDESTQEPVVAQVELDALAFAFGEHIAGPYA
jgi:hypothetical protein